MRELILKVDPRIVEALVTHTQAATDAAKARCAPAPATAAPVVDVEVPDLGNAPE